MLKTSLTTEEIRSMPKSVMIFGCGYVGAALAEKLLSLGIKVGALTRNVKKADDLRKIGLSDVLVEDLHSESWHQELKGLYDAVVNCVSSAGGGLAGYRKSYVQGQKSILKWAKGRSIKTYVYTGSTSVYPQDGGLNVDETTDTSLASSTGQLLLEAEQVLMSARGLFESNYVLRLAGIYGPERHYLLTMLRSGETVIPGYGDYFLNLVHRDDIVHSICKVLAGANAGNSGVYNLSDGNPATKVEVANWLAEKLNLSPPKFDPNQVSQRLKRRGGRMPSRRILNHKFCETFQWKPMFPSFKSGYEQLI